MSGEFEGQNVGASAAVKNTLGLLPVIALSAALTTPAAYAQQQQQRPQAQQAEQGVTELETITVEGGTGTPTNTNAATPGVSRIPTTVQDTPQVINVISQQELQKRAVTNLSDVITRVPGVTMSAGEGGGGGMGGDSFNIRGVTAVGNIFVDGIRDTGVSSRDAFNMEQVEVFKGGAGSTFGAGGGGGSINMSSKAAKDHFFADILKTVGTDNYYRAAVDVNVPLTDQVAFRLNAVGLSRDFAERDHIFQKRWGVAPTITFGMQSDTKLTLSYLHQEDWGRPDNGVPRFGVPTSAGGNGILRPVTTEGVRRQNYYGFIEDNEEYKVDRFTATLEHEFNDNLKLTNVFRASSFWHDRFVTSMPASGIYGLSAACQTMSTACSMQMGTGGPGGSAGWAHSTKGMEGETYQNQTTLNSSFDTGRFAHELALGMDLSRENLTHKVYSVTGLGTATIDLHNPALVSHGRTRTHSYDSIHKVDTVGLTAYDRVNLGSGFYAIGNARLEKVSVDSRRTDSGARASYDDTLFSWMGALEYKPWESHTYYISYGRTLLPPTPTTEYMNLVDGTVSDPQESTTIEVGGKWNLLDDRLGLGASVFVTRLSNEISDNGTGTISINKDRRKIAGLELSATGKLTDQISVTAGYSYLHGRVKSGANTGFVLGLMPAHSGNIWADYQVTEKLNIGAGLNYTSYRYTSDYNPETKAGGRLPGHVTVDAALNYQFNDRFGIQLNAINLFNEQTFEKSHGARHMVPGQGRTFLLTAKTSF